jgi:hypothetical protein
MSTKNQQQSENRPVEQKPVEQKPTENIPQRTIPTDRETNLNRHGAIEKR